MVFLNSGNKRLLQNLLTFLTIGVTWCVVEGQTNVLRHIRAPDKDSPKCSVRTLNKPNVFTEVEPNVFRILGEYGKIILNCSALYLLDFDFDGTRPSEAIHLFFWKDVKPSVSNNGTISSNVQRFGLEVNILSIQTLYEEFDSFRKSSAEKNRVKQLFHKNLKSPINYSRTGKYVIRGMFPPDSGKKLEVYFFLEESNSERAFIENSYTSSTYVYEDTAGIKTVTVPCRPTYYTENVNLGVSNHTVLKFITKFNPTTGFTIFGVTNEFTNETTIYCEATFNSTSSSRAVKLSKSFKYEERNLSENLLITIPKSTPTYSSINTYGEDKLDNQIIDSRGVQVDHAEIIVTSDEYFASLKCSFSVPDDAKRGDFRFQAIGLQHPSGYRFGQEFSLPVYSNRSYYLRAAEDNDHPDEYLIEYLPPCGTFYCTNGPTYSYAQYVSGFNRGYEFPPGTSWTDLIYSGAPPDSNGRLEMMSPMPGTTLYSYMSFEFLCRGMTFIVSRPILWFTRSINGTVKLHWIDTKSYEGRSILKINLTVDIAQIFCRVSWYQSDSWRERAIDLNFEDAMRSRPNITTSQRPHQFYMHSQNQKISCEASGIPTPSVWWEDKNGVGLTNKSKGSSEYTFSTVTSDSAGDYVCIAENDYQERTKRIFAVSTEAHNAPAGIITAIVLSILFMFAVIIGTMSYYWWDKTSKMVLTVQEIKEFAEGFDPKQRGDDEASSKPLAQPYKRNYEISKSQYQIENRSVLGSGAYGIVKKGIVNGVQVAVKTIRPGANKSYLKTLLSELKILIYLGKHPNLIELVGANTVQLERGIAFVFVEFCDHGNLLSYLRTNREKFIHSQKMPRSESGYDVETLNQWAIHIAQGMAFLKTNKVIHGDLAARNVLLTKNMVAKITDFGLSRQLYNYSMYMKQNQEPLPWRWMAIESLSDLSFSYESDIWSYGVTLWEIYSLGQVPFPGMSWDLDFVSYLRNGNRMGCPKVASDEMFSNVISRCWANDPTKRPSFVEICHILNPQLILEETVANHGPSQAVMHFNVETLGKKTPDHANSNANDTAVMQRNSENV